MEFLDLEQGSDLWKETRKRYITSTDVAVIMNLSPFKTPYQLYLEKMDLAPPQEVTERMKEGSRLEPIAREWFANKYNVNIKVGVVVFGIFMASLDGYFLNPVSGNYENIEIKCGVKSFRDAEDGVIADYYLAQIQQALHCTWLNKTTYIAFNGSEVVEIEVKRDQEFIDKMIPVCEEFYKCLMTFTPPPMTEKDYVQNDDPQVRASMERALQYQKDIKNLERLFEQEKEFLKSFAGQSSMKSGSGKITRILRRGAIKYNEVEQLKGVDLEPHRSASIEVWRISNGET